ncbi:unnamed protein product [Closterium sp. Yama58-4]|nr:unnamed protein product [Closterium sp. Yama58-4]
MSNVIHELTTTPAGAHAVINSSLFNSTGTNSASDTGKKRKVPSPGGPTGCATAAHTQQQHAKQSALQTPRACYSRCVLGPANASLVPPNSASAIATSILGSATVVDPNILGSATVVDPNILGSATVVDPNILGSATVVTPNILGSATVVAPNILGSATVVDPHILGSAVTGQVGESDGSSGMNGADGTDGTGGRARWHSGDDEFGGAGACPQQQPVCNADGMLGTPSDENQWGSAEGLRARDERGVRYQSKTIGCCARDVQDECATDDEPLPRCQAARTGSAPNQRVRRRSIAERQRRGRISEGLRRLRAKVRGRGDTCAMLDRAVGYVDALEKRVMELEGVVIAAAGPGRNGFPGNAFAGGAFGGNAFANDAAALRAMPAALASVCTSLGSDAVAGWPGK